MVGHQPARLDRGAQYRDTLYPTAADKPRAPADKKSKAPPVLTCRSYVYKFRPLMERR
jgi:hypothetical protein